MGEARRKEERGGRVRGGESVGSTRRGGGLRAYLRVISPLRFLCNGTVLPLMQCCYVSPALSPACRVAPGVAGRESAEGLSGRRVSRRGETRQVRIWGRRHQSSRGRRAIEASLLSKCWVSKHIQDMGSLPLIIGASWRGHICFLRVIGGRVGHLHRTLDETAANPPPKLCHPSVKVSGWAILHDAPGGHTPPIRASMMPRIAGGEFELGFPC